MKKNIIISGITLLICLYFSSCKKFLDVQSKEEVFESELLSTRDGVYSALNGIYQGLSDQDLYGKELTMGYMDALAQYYDTQSSYSPYFLSYKFNYDIKDYKNIFTMIWSKQYRLLLEINVLLENLEDPAFQVLAAEERDLLIGELYAVRAFLHFDLLRLFGPVYSSQPDERGIPYSSQQSLTAKPMLSAKDVMERIRQDLDRSLELLKNDPVLQYNGGPVQKYSSDYSSLRYFRFNYYACLLLSARVSLYAGDRKLALEHATKLIQETVNKFPFIANQAEALSDPVFSSETLFAIQNRNLNLIYNAYFNPALTDDEILAPHRLAQIYSSENDYRYVAWSSSGDIGDKNYRVFGKYSNISGKIAPNLEYFQPLIRKSEAYLIAAEAEPDLAKGQSYLQSLQIHRGLDPDLPPQPTQQALLEALTAEYTREFWGEGQLFFYYKRKNITTIPGSREKTNFLPPLPTVETDFR
ncbi:MAG: RagB/SusD family nutrient uptake outer membrane protein [Sphingobacterium sp.]|jgi:hypothetical protein|nr:RagB/SusD family nutrient uptake outer membrane protein [Sphingobacterium sp.]